MPGYFPKEAQILFIGQNPGQLSTRASGWDDASYSEEKQFKKFQKGYSQGLFEAPIGNWIYAGMRGEVPWAFTNVIKCRTPNNSVPKLTEIENCRSLLEKQISALSPRAIITLGSLAYEWFGTRVAIDGVRGRAIPIRTPFYYGIILPMYHPAYYRYQHDKFTRMYLRKIEALVQNERLYRMVMDTPMFTLK